MNIANIGKAHAVKALNRWRQDEDFNGIVADKDHYLFRLYGETTVPVGLDRLAIAETLTKHGLKVTTQRINDFEYGYYSIITKALKS